MLPKNETLPSGREITRTFGADNQIASEIHSFGLLVHSDQGTQFTGHDWQDFLKAHGLVSSMSRRGNCHDNAVAESFFQLLKRERIKRKIYVTREEAKSDVFSYIEMFYNTRRQHGHNDGLSPVEFEKQFSKRGF